VPSVTPTTWAKTNAPTTCRDEIDVIFLVDSSGSISTEKFAEMQAFITDVVALVESTGNPQTRYALTTFADHVETHVRLGDDTSSTSATDFSAVVNNMAHTGGLTCTSGGLAAAFAANFGAVLPSGKVDPANTRLRQGVQTVVVMVTDGRPTTSPNGIDTCYVSSGDCVCDANHAFSLAASAAVYDEIKQANTDDFPNTVVALGFGAGVDASFLDSVSDEHIEAMTFSEGDKYKVLQMLTSAFECEKPKDPCVDTWATYEVFGEQLFEMSRMNAEEWGTVLWTTDESTISGDMYTFEGPTNERPEPQRRLGNFSIQVHQHHNDNHTYALEMSSVPGWRIDQVRFAPVNRCPSASELEYMSHGPNDSGGGFPHVFTPEASDFEADCLQSFDRLGVNDWVMCQGESPSCERDELSDPRKLSVSTIDRRCAVGYKVLLRARMCLNEFAKYAESD
jgi:hypothetical protein